ncbi:MAG: DsbC family protein [Brachymonas sp.]|nr:DsbC family protein [Brachymonas sp.]
MKKHLRLALLPLFALPIVACSKPGAPAAAASAASQAAPAVATVSAAASTAATAAPGEAAIRKNLQERLPGFPPIAEVRSTPVAGLYEVRVGADGIFYTDAQGDYLIQGAILDTKNRKNLTEERLQALNSIAFDKLPLKDAIVSKKGDGSRKIAVFADPNCGYCKRFESELQKLNNVTVYTFLYPILGPDSTAKAKNIWCAKDRSKVWHDWMIDGKTPSAAQCEDDVTQRNLALGRQFNINGTPAIVLGSGQRIGGFVEAAALEEALSAKH